jgi:hypothetical protein
MSSFGHGGRSTVPYAFTEQGVAMLSSVLASECAIALNIEIMRAFVRLRDPLASDKELARRFADPERRLERKLATDDQAIAGILDAIRQLMSPPRPAKRAIGLVTLAEKKNPSGQEDGQHSAAMGPGVAQRNTMPAAGEPPRLGREKAKRDDLASGRDPSDARRADAQAPGRRAAQRQHPCDPGPALRQVSRQLTVGQPIGGDHGLAEGAAQPACADGKAWIRLAAQASGGQVGAFRLPRDLADPVSGWCRSSA